MSKQKPICVHNMFWAYNFHVLNIQWTICCHICGLVDAKIRASDNYLPVLFWFKLDKHSIFWCKCKRKSSSTVYKTGAAMMQYVLQYTEFCRNFIYPQQYHSGRFSIILVYLWLWLRLSLHMKHYVISYQQSPIWLITLIYGVYRLIQFLA